MSRSASPPDLDSQALSGVFYLSLLGLMFFALGVTVLIPIIPLFITDELGASERWIGTATLAVAFTAVMSRIPTGALSDRQGRRRLMLIGAGLGVIAAALYLVSHNIVVFMVARTATGASLAVFTTASKAFAADLAPPRRRGEALGLNNAAFSLAAVLSPLLSEGLKNAVGFRAVFAFYGVASVLALAITYTLPRVKPAFSTSAGAGRDMRDTLSSRGVWAAILLMVGLGAILALMFTFYPLLADRKQLFEDAPGLFAAVAMGLGLSIWSLLDTLVEPVAGRISDRIGRQPVAIPGLVLAIVGAYLLSRATSTFPAYAAIAIMSIGWGSARAVADTVSQDVIPPVLRGMSAAILYTSFDLAIGIDAQILSTLIDGADFSRLFTTVLLMVGIFGTLGLLLSTRVPVYERPAVPIEEPEPAEPAKVPALHD